MIQKIKVFKSKFWAQKKILRVYRIFYERINFYENFESAIFTQKSTFLTGFQKSICCLALVEVIYSQNKSADLIIF